VRALLLPVLLLASCGLAPQDELTGRRAATGVAPWQDLGAVELCLGNERVGPGGSATGGFCADLNTPPEKICAADGDCASREQCVCGRCTVKFCTSNAECGTERSCSFSDRRCLPRCRVDDDCVDLGEICLGGLCRGQCGRDTDCQYAELCGSQNRCVVAACGRDADCRERERCRVQRLPRATGEPSVLAVPGEQPGLPPRFVMYLEMDDISGELREIWRARSRDGIRFAFDPARPIVQGRAPSAVQTAAGVRLYVETAGGIAMTESADGIAFPAPALVIPGDFRAPGAAMTPSGVIVYAQVGDRAGIAVWTGSGAPRTVLRPADVSDPRLWRNVERVGSPSALVVSSPLGEPAIHLWFDAFGKESGTSIQFGEMVEIPPNDSIGFASTLLAQPDKLIPYPYNPVLDRIVAFLAHRAELSPAVVRVPGEERYLLYYVGASGDGMESDGIGVSTNPPRL
jgi:hypothetical protein